MERPENRTFGGCPLHHPFFRAPVGRRDFLRQASAVAAGIPLAAGAVGTALAGEEAAAPTLPATPARKEPAVVKVAYLRHPAAFAGGWPGHGFNNDAACKEYSEKLQSIGRELGVEMDLTGAEVPFTDAARIEGLVAAIKARKPDALLLCPIGIFSPWDRANEVIAAAGLPTLIFTQIGTSFTMNTAPLIEKSGIHLVSSLDIADVRPGLVPRTEQPQGVEDDVVVVLPAAQIDVGKLG